MRLNKWKAKEQKKPGSGERRKENLPARAFVSLAGSGSRPAVASPPGIPPAKRCFHIPLTAGGKKRFVARLTIQIGAKTFALNKKESIASIYQADPAGRDSHCIPGSRGRSSL
jgi:hypothetical protein